MPQNSDLASVSSKDNIISGSSPPRQLFNVGPKSQASLCLQQSNPKTFRKTTFSPLHLLFLSLLLLVYNAFRKPVLPHALSPSGIVAQQQSKMAFGPNPLLTQNSRYRNHWIAAGAATTVLFGPVIWNRSLGGLLSRNVAHCAAATASTPTPRKIK